MKLGNRKSKYTKFNDDVISDTMVRTEIVEVELTVQDDDSLEDFVTKSSQRTMIRAQTSLEQLKVSLTPVNLESIRESTPKNLFKKSPSISKETLLKNKQEGGTINLGTKALRRNPRRKSKKLKIFNHLHDDTKKMTH